MKSSRDLTPEQVLVRAANRFLHHWGFRSDGTPERRERKHTIKTVRLTKSRIKTFDFCPLSHRVPLAP